jgi:hypothetical protein
VGPADAVHPALRDKQDIAKWQRDGNLIAVGVADPESACGEFGRPR